MSKDSSSNGITFVEAFQILFIGLKLSGNIDWSWWVVMVPSLYLASLQLLGFIAVFLAAAAEVISEKIN